MQLRVMSGTFEYIKQVNFLKVWVNLILDHWAMVLSSFQCIFLLAIIIMYIDLVILIYQYKAGSTFEAEFA